MMKNQFEKKDNSGVIVTLSIAALTAGAAIYLYMTNKGTETRNGIKHRLKDKAKDFASHHISKKTGISKKLIKKIADLVVK